MISQLFSWSSFIIPWLTLFLMKREEIRRYMPVGLLASLLTTIIHDAGITFGFWEVLAPAPPMYEMLPYFYGLIPVLTMWIFKFTNGRVWRYIIVNIILDVGFAFTFLGYILPSLGIYRLVGVTRFQVVLINLVHFSLLYVYQKWHEGEFNLHYKTSFSAIPQAAAGKPFLNNKDDK